MAVVRYERYLGDVVAFSADAVLDLLPGGCAVIFPKQVHGDVIWDVTAKDNALSGVHEADAIVTAETGLAVAVRTADCLPLLLFSPGKKVVAAVHAGWKSTRLDIVAKTVGLLKKKYGADPAGIKVAIGPCIRPRSYQVGAEFKAFFPKEVAELDGRLCFDIAAANRRQLLGQGILPENIFDSGYDTYADKQWHSFRRDGDASGRSVHAIMMRG
ncbi:MAG: peptidoglycan editing factor PgeF [Candidatus Omnitrophota bacterium]